MKSWVSECFYSNLRREGWEINDLSPLSWQFFWNFMTFGWFSKVWEFWNRFLFQENSNISNLISWNVRLFWILSFAKDIFIAENRLCFRACNSRIVTYDQEFCLVVWFCVLITLTESFSLKSFLWEVMVLSKTCVRFRNHVFKRFE